MRRVLAVLALLILFVLTAAVGTYAGRSQVRRLQVTKPGWCCMAKKKQCVVTENMQSCRASGGSLFNWNGDTCASLCGR